MVVIEKEVAGRIVFLLCAHEKKNHQATVNTLDVSQVLERTKIKLEELPPPVRAAQSWESNDSRIIFGIVVQLGRTFNSLCQQLLVSLERSFFI